MLSVQPIVSLLHFKFPFSHVIPFALPRAVYRSPAQSCTGRFVCGRLSCESGGGGTESRRGAGSESRRCFICFTVGSRRVSQPANDGAAPRAGTDRLGRRTARLGTAGSSVSRAGRHRGFLRERGGLIPRTPQPRAARWEISRNTARLLHGRKLCR